MMKKLFILILFTGITIYVFSDKFVKTTLEDFNLNGKVKTFIIIHKYEGLKSYETLFHFDKKGVLYKIEKVYGKRDRIIKKLIYSENGQLIRTEEFDKKNKLMERNTFYYNDLGIPANIFNDNKARSVKYKDQYEYNSEKD